MFQRRDGRQRGHTDLGWLDSRHSFSFGSYHDPRHWGFRSLRVLNDDRVQPGAGFGTHPHRDMEILTWVLEGGLRHADSMGHEQELRSGELQAMSAGSGITHSEHNASDREAVRFLQIWLLPEARDLPPRYAQRGFPVREQPDRWHRVAERRPRDGALPIAQDASLDIGVFAAGQRLERVLPAGRHLWLQLATGAVEAGGLALRAGDGLAVSDEDALVIGVREPSELLLFELA